MPEAKMGLWVEYEVWRQRRAELLREAQERALAREARRVREAFAAVEERSTGGWAMDIEVRWGLSEDEPAVADLLQLNGMPRWVAFEERFVVAERDGRVVGALRYATESKRLSLGLLVVDPWAGEARVAGALYTGARDLALELGVGEILATRVGRANYPARAGYRRAGRGWYSPVSRSDGAVKGPDGEPSIRSVLARALPFRRAFRG